jgi:hypothetical protein
MSHKPRLDPPAMRDGSAVRSSPPGATAEGTLLRPVSPLLRHPAFPVAPSAAMYRAPGRRVNLQGAGGRVEQASARSLWCRSAPVRLCGQAHAAVIGVRDPKNRAPEIVERVR